MRFIAIENGMTVWALAPPADGPTPAPACDAPAQSTQNTTSHVSQNMSSDCGCRAHFGTTSRRWRPIKSSN
jgi:hypothetical protein